MRYLILGLMITLQASCGVDWEGMDKVVKDSKAKPETSTDLSTGSDVSVATSTDPKATVKTVTSSSSVTTTVVTTTTSSSVVKTEVSDAQVDQDGSEVAQNQLIGAWQSPCDAGIVTRLVFNKDGMEVVITYVFSDEKCVHLEQQFSQRLKYSTMDDQIIVFKGHGSYIVFRPQDDNTMSSGETNDVSDPSFSAEIFYKKVE